MSGWDSGTVLGFQTLRVEVGLSRSKFSGCSFQRSRGFEVHVRIERPPAASRGWGTSGLEVFDDFASHLGLRAS